MKDNKIMPGLIVIGVALVLFVSCLAAFATKHHDVGLVLASLAGAGFVVGGGWLADRTPSSTDRRALVRRASRCTEKTTEQLGKHARKGPADSARPSVERGLTARPPDASRPPWLRRCGSASASFCATSCWASALSCWALPSRTMSSRPVTVPTVSFALPLTSSTTPLMPSSVHCSSRSCCLSAMTWIGQVHGGISPQLWGSRCPEH